MNRHVTLKTFSRGDGPLTHVSAEDQLPLPPPFDQIDDEPPIAALTDDVMDKFVTLDDTITLNIPKPKNAAEEAKLVNTFLSGLRKLFSAADNWTFLQPLMISMEHCARCQTCSEACPIFVESGENELWQMKRST